MTTIGQILVNDALPESVRDYGRTMDKDALDGVLARIASESPDKYVDIAHKLTQIGRHASFEEGTTLRLNDLNAPVNLKPFMDYVNKEEDEIFKDKSLSDSDRQEALAMLYSATQDKIQGTVYDESLAVDNPFALQVKSKARGNKGQLTSLLATPGTYANTRGKMVPLFIKRSFAQGLRPEEYWSAAHGGRVGVVSTKQGTPKGGYLGKLLAAASLNVVVTGEDCGTSNGIPVPVDAGDNVGAVLAKDIGGFKAGTVLDKRALQQLQAKGVDEIVVRSALTCQQDKGVCQFCTGKRETGGFPEIGYNLGQVASSALAEQVAQTALSTKHSGKISKGRGFSGFEVVKNLATVPEVYPDRAALATKDGTVEKIEPAPQGGTNIWIDGEVHHALQDMDVFVKPGDKVEAGDILSNGVANPAEVINQKGLGEGRLYFANRFTSAFKDTGLGVHRRNVEAVSRAIVDHVELQDENGEDGHLPGDVVTYSSWSKTYKPRSDSQELETKRAVGGYLEQPYMHYSIGTRVTPTVSSRLLKHGYKNVLTNQKPVAIKPTAISLVKTPEYIDDWMAKLGSSYLESRLLKDVQTGAESDAHGLNPIPGVARAIEFGEPPKGSVSPY